jgi:putative ABC transport system permease protein
MMLLKMAFRNIFRQKRRSLLTALTMFGGFSLATMSIGWADGSYNFIINMFTRNQLGHIQIHARGYREDPSIYKTIRNYQQVEDTVSRIRDVEYWAPRLFAAGLVSVKNNSTGAQVIGIDPLLENDATHFSKKIVMGEYFSDKPAHEAILGKGLAETLEAAVGDEIVIVSQAADGSIANDIYKIIGIASTGDDMSDRMSFYMNLHDAQDLFVLPGQVHEIAVIVTKLGVVKKVTEEIRERLHNPDLEVSPWQVFAKSFYQAMSADKQGMWIMLFVIILVVAVGVLNTVLMSVLERQKEYGLLKAMGTKPASIVGLVLYEVNILAIVSVFIGAIIGTLVNYLLSHHGITLPQAFTYGGMEFKTMYTEVNTRSLIIPTITVLVAATFISIFPAFRAAHTEPARTMRM